MFVPLSPLRLSPITHFAFGGSATASTIRGGSRDFIANERGRAGGPSRGERPPDRRDWERCARSLVRRKDGSKEGRVEGREERTSGPQ